jgi:cytochrome b
MLTGKQPEGLGHNPAGALAMLALMVLILLIGLTGYWSVKEFYGDLMNEAHEMVSTFALVVVVIHVFAAIAMSFLQKENLVRAMVTGTKKGLPDEAISYAHYWVGVVLMLVFAFSFFMVFSSALPSLTR